jgi:hypothetical protein
MEERAMVNSEEFCLLLIRRELKNFADLIKYGPMVPIDETLDFINRIADLIGQNSTSLPYGATAMHIASFASRASVAATQLYVGFHEHTLSEVEIRSQMLSKFSALDLEALNVIHLIENSFHPIQSVQPVPMVPLLNLASISAPIDDFIEPEPKEQHVGQKRHSYLSEDGGRKRLKV